MLLLVRGIADMVDADGPNKLNRGTTFPLQTPSDLCTSSATMRVVNVRASKGKVCYTLRR